MTLRKTHALAVAAAIGCLTISVRPAAAAAPNITFSATGTFAAAPSSGADTLKLAGEPFGVSIVVNAATAPFKTGPNFAAYNKLKLTGAVHSGLLGSTPVNVASGESTIEQAIDTGKYDQFTMEAPIKVVGINLTIKAVIEMPIGTISKPLLHTFTAIKLSPGNATVTYSDGTNSTVLSVQTGTLTATIPGAGAPTTAALMNAGRQGALEQEYAETRRYAYLPEPRASFRG